MSKSKTLVMCYEAGPLVGMGHASRCTAISQAWEKKGGQAYSVITSPLSKEYQAGVDEGFFDRLIEVSLQADWVVVDGYAFSDEYMGFLGKGRAKIARVIDDPTASGLEYADVVISPTSALPSPIAPGKPGRRWLCGMDYAPIRKEIRDHRPAVCLAEKATRPIAQRIVVAMGASDSDRHTERVVAALLRCRQRYQVDVFLGPFADSRRFALEYHEKLRICGFSIYRNCPRFPKVAAMADLAIVPCSQTLLEMACIGVPSLATFTAENQREMVKYFTQNGLSMDTPGLADCKEYSEVVDLFATRPDWRRKATSSLMTMVDGLGAERIVEALWESA